MQGWLTTTWRRRPDELIAVRVRGRSKRVRMDDIIICS